MQRTTTLFFTALLLLITITSCRRPHVRGAGDVKAEARNLTATFDHIEISGPVDAKINVAAGSTVSLNMEGYANLLPYIKSKIENNTLKIYVDNEARLRTKKNVIATINMPVLAGVEVAGSNDVTITGNVTGDELDLELAGSGNVNIEALNTTNFNAEIAGAADILINGGAITSATYEIAGSGEIHAFKLQTVNTTIEVAGSGDAEVAASAKLDVSVGGSGSVKYKGQPVVTKDIAGSGSVDQVP